MFGSGAVSRLTIAVVPIYGRYELTIWCLGKLKRLPGVDHVIAVGSNLGDKEVARIVGIEYCQYENKPLSQKWQHGIAFALKQGADGIMICGSDDIWQVNTVPRLWEELDKGVVLAGAATWYLMMLETGKVYLQRYRIREDSLGSGRLFSAKFIKEKLGGLLFGKDVIKSCSLDGYLTRRIITAGGKQIAIEGIAPALCKLNKGKDQITSASSLLSSDNIISKAVYTSFTNNLLFEWKQYSK